MKKTLLFWSLIVLPLCSMFAQRTLTGTISSDKPEPLVGASVVVKGTTKEAITGIDGKFSVDVPKDAQILMVSYTGFETKEIVLGSSNVLDVILSEGKVLEEVIITACGIKKDKSNLGYVVSQVSREDLTMAHTTSVANALSAKIAGIRVLGEGDSFSSSSIIIRGGCHNSLDPPLLIVDGVTNYSWGAIDDLNSDEIKSVSVLKGPPATSLYGSRAANGVVLVTTKSGKSKKKAVYRK